ncbi:MAG TPA: hypothetical protein VG370_28305 [Chloroflexota bacterium]|jgi:hypothetical protein|nr:hypothetical protein [Chloroflexota bacterium]
MDQRRETRPGLEAMIEQLLVAGCTELEVLDPDWVAGTSPRGSRLTLSWDEQRGSLTLIRYLTRRDGATVIGRFHLLASAASAAATL